MASPQVEDGCIKIAFSLFVAIIQYDWLIMERRVFDVVMLFTYGRQVTKAQISVEDIKLMLKKGDARLRNDRVQEALDGLVEKHLVFRQQLANGEHLLGIQKDFDKWGVHSEKVDKLVHPTNVTDCINTKAISTTRVDKDVQSNLLTTERLLWYMLTALNLKYGYKLVGVELKRCKAIYTQALGLTRSPEDAYWAVRDYADYLLADDWFRGNVKFPFAYMLTRFERWYKAIPKKTWDLREEEKHIGRRYKWNFKIKNWEVDNGFTLVEK